MGIYYLSSNCCFREDFLNPGTIAANGGVITGTGIANKIFLPTASTNLINYKIQASYLFRLNVLTIASVVRLSAFTGSFRTLLWCGNSSAEATYQVGLNNGSNKPFWYDGNSVSTPSGTFTPSSTKSSLLYVCDGTNVIFYVNGISLGSVVAATSSTIADANNTLIVGNSLASQPFSNPIYTTQIYNKVFTASDALDWHNMAMETY